MTNLHGAGCVVTGVAGFVGSHLAERLVNIGCRVVGVDDFSSGREENIRSLKDSDRFALHNLSIRENGLIERLCDLHGNLQFCFHLAAIVSVPYSMSHPDETMDINFRATGALIRDAHRLGFKRFIFAGSAAEYGNDRRLPLREAYADGQTVHLSPYGRAKYLASTETAASPLGVALRFFNIYGPRQDPGSPYSGVISRFVDMALERKPLTIFGDGLQTRDFIYVSDVVEAYLAAAGLSMSNPIPPAGIYNVGTGQAVTIRQLADTIMNLAQYSEPVRFLPERPGDISHSLADVHAFETAAGWRAQVPLSSGLRQTLLWAKKSGT